MSPSVPDMVIIIPLGLHTDDINSEIAQELKILVQCFPLRAYPIGTQFIYDLRQCQHMGFVSIFRENFYEIQ